VPHFYNKIYTTPVYEDKKHISLTITASVRYRNPVFKIAENCDPFEIYLLESQSINVSSIGRGAVYNVLSAKQIFDEGTKKLQQNLYYFCKYIPEFQEGEIPMDGATGQFVPDDIRLGKLKDG
jgi:hypothetical protein